MSRPANLQTHFLECFEYQDGRLYWKKRESAGRRWNSRYAGTEAGCIYLNGYRMVNFPWGRFGSHRIIFVMHHGYLPELVDHINGDPSDNRLENLRAANRAENMRNSKISARNNTGIKGVAFRNGLWRTYIYIGGRQIDLGGFKTIELAAQVRKEAERKYFGEFANDR